MIDPHRYYRGFRIKFKLFTNSDGEPEVKMGDHRPIIPYWRPPGTVSLLKQLAKDPESIVQELEDGVYWTPKSEPD